MSYDRDTVTVPTLTSVRPRTWHSGGGAVGARGTSAGTKRSSRPSPRPGADGKLTGAHGASSPHGPQYWSDPDLSHSPHMAFGGLT